MMIESGLRQLDERIGFLFYKLCQNKNTMLYGNDVLQEYSQTGKSAKGLSKDIYELNTNHSQAMRSVV